MSSEHLTYSFSRSGQAPSNPQQWPVRAEAAVSAAVAHGTGRIMLARSGARTTGTMTVPAGAAPAQPWMALAQGYGSKAAPMEEDRLEDHRHMVASTPHVAILQMVPSLPSSSVQAGADPVELARMMSYSVPDGGWVCATFRKRTAREYAKWGAWLSFRRAGGFSGTHHSLRSGAVAVSFMAGGQSPGDAASALTTLASSMPGFDLEARARPLRRFHRFIAGLPIGAAALAAGFFAPSLVDQYITDPQLIQPLTQLLELLVPVLFIAGACALLAGVLALTQLLPGEARRFARASARGIPYTPPRKTGRIRSPREAKTVTSMHQNADGTTSQRVKQIAAHPGDYPFDDTVFLAHPDVFAMIASPHGSESSGEASATERSTPPALIEAQGPFIGTNQNDRVHLESADANLGVAILGRPGSGKSLLVQALYGWAVLERVNPSGRPKHPGRRNGLIAIEAKGDGAWQYQKWAKTLGDKVRLMDAADPRTYALDIFDVPGTLTERAAFATAAMVYVYGEDSIGPRSREALDSVFPAAFALSRTVVEPRVSGDTDVVETLVQDHSFARYAHILLGGQGDEAFNELAAVVKAWSQDTSGGAPNPDAVAAWRALQFIAEKTPSNRASYCEAPRNKIKDLAVQLDVWFSPTRKKVSWSDVVDFHRSVIINTGSSPTGRQIDDVHSKVLSSLLMYSLWAHIRRTCSGWAAQGRYTSLFTDELSLLAGESGEIITQFKDQGRSYGFRAVLATQRPEQLQAQVRNNVLAYDTLISFAQNDPNTSEEVARNVGSEFTAEDIKHIDPYHAVVRTTVHGKTQSGVIVSVPHFAADITGFPALQGYDS